MDRFATAIIDWVFEAEDINETTIDEKLREEGIDLSKDVLPKTPSASRWALKAVPTFITGTPIPTIKQIEDSIRQEFDDEFLDSIRDATMQDVSLFDSSPMQFSAPSPTPALQPKASNDLFKSIVVRNLASTTGNKENVFPENRQAQLSDAPVVVPPSQIGSLEPSTPQSALTHKPLSLNPPASILRTPGTVSTKKVVTFAPTDDVVGQAAKLSRPGRIRSGLPKTYPGKFPSPFTPKNVIDRLDLAETSAKNSPMQQELDSRKADTEDEKSEAVNTEPDSARQTSSNRTRESKEDTQKLLPAREEDARRTHSQSSGTTNAHILEQAFQLNKTLEVLLAQKETKKTQHGAKSTPCDATSGRRNLSDASVDDNGQAEYWKRKYEAECQQSKRLTQENQYLLQFAAEKNTEAAQLKQRQVVTDHQIVRLKQDLEFLKLAVKGIVRSKVATALADEQADAGV